MRRAILIVAVLIAAVVVASSAVAYADKPVQNESHSWNGYHWGVASSDLINGEFTLDLGDNVTDTASSTWDSILQNTSSTSSTTCESATSDVSPTSGCDWSDSTKLNTTIVPGANTNSTGPRTPKQCRPTSGRDEVCNARYGRTGWIGLATVWVSGSHIAQGTVKVNDTYFDKSTYRYNNLSEKQHVMCQEIGHTLGLDHQDESGATLNTCMDYYHNPDAADTQSTTPNYHDYEELGIIYNHTDGTSTLGQSATTNKMPDEANQPDFNDSRQWGKKVWSSPDGQEELWVRDFGGGHKVFNWAIRADKGTSSPRE